MKQAVVFLANGFEEIEAVTVIDILRRADIEVDVISITEERHVQGSHGIVLLANDMHSIGDPREYYACVLPGGMPGSVNLAESDFVRDFVTRMFRRNKLCCAVCAAPMALYKFGLLTGKKCTAYPGVLEECDDIIRTGERVVVDDNIITANGPGSAAEFAFTILSKLNNPSKAAAMRDSMIYNCQVACLKEKNGNTAV